MIHAVILHERRFFRRADHTNHSAAKMLSPLAEDQANTASRRVDQDGLTCLGGVAFLDEEGGCHALQHHRGTLFKANRIRHFH